MITCNSGTLGCYEGTNDPIYCDCAVIIPEPEPEPELVGGPIEVTCGCGDVITCNSGTLGCYEGTNDPTYCDCTIVALEPITQTYDDEDDVAETDDLSISEPSEDVEAEIGIEHSHEH